jgi:gluconokinase
VGGTDTTNSSTAAATHDDAEPPFVLAVDVGTSSIRVALYDARAREVEGTQARTLRGFRITPDGGAEMDADDSVAEVARVIDAALASLPSQLTSHVEALALACFWHSLVGVDRAGRAVTPVFGWADTRAARFAERLREEADEGETHARTGCRLHASYWPAKLLWLRTERPAAWSDAARWLSFSDLLALRLCGDCATSVSMASGTGLLDTRACAWDSALIRLLNLTGAHLPRIAADGETLRLNAVYAARWPLLRRAAVFHAIGDGAANNVGEGCTTPGSVALMVGTSAAMRVAYEGEPPRELDASLWCYRLDRRRVVVGGALSDGGGLYEWLARALNVETDEETLASFEPDAHGLTLLPFWAGERSTGWNAHATGAILGLTGHTRPVEILRAAMESVAYRLAHVARALEVFAPCAEVRASGGALRASAVWRQLFADVLARRVMHTRVAEASSRGAVLLALEALGKIKSVSDIQADAGDACHPDAARHAVYRRAAARQQRLYELLVADQSVARVIDRDA